MDVFKTLLLDTPDSLNAITGTLQIVNGGTGATDAAGARDNLLPDYTANVGKVLTVNSGATDVEWTTNGAGTVTSVNLTAGTGVSVSGGPITSSGSITVTNTAPDQTVAIAAGTGISISGSYPSFTVTNSAPSLGGDVVGPASSTDNAIVRFDGTTGKLVQNSAVTIADTTGDITTSGLINGTTIPTSSTLLVSGGALGTPSSGTLTSCTGLPISTGVSGLGTNVATALAVNVGSSGAVVTNGGALGTPSSGTVTNLTGTASININGTVGATTPGTVAATTLSASGASTFTNSAPRAIGGLGFRNRIINGDMRIDQRNEGAAVTASAAFPVDRFQGSIVSSGAFSLQRSTSVVPAGFTHSVGVTVTTADATVAAGDLLNIETIIEGNNVPDLGFGTASAKTVTISFWVRGSVTGTYCVVVGNSSSSGTGVPNRSYVSEYTIDVANTWEYKTISVPGDTSGTWMTNNTRGIILRFGLSVGTTFQQAAGSWSTGNVSGSSNQTQLMTTLSATWYVTGIQLEVGNAATEFERRPFGQELALCQRYYATSIETGKIVTDFATLNASGVGGIVGFSTAANGDLFVPIRFPVSLRSNPTLTVYSGANRTAGSVRDMTTGTDVTGFSNGGSTSNNQGISYIAGNTLTANRGYGFHYVASAEY